MTDRSDIDEALVQLVMGAMGSALACLPEWLSEGKFDKSKPLEPQLRSDAESHMQWRGQFQMAEALRAYDERTYAFIAGQFTSDVVYDGAEVIGRIRSIQHSLEPHGEGECIVCKNDPEGI